jgi:hypothetical protein
MIDSRIEALKKQGQAAIDKIKFLSSEIAINHMEKELLRTEAEIAELNAEKDKVKEEKPINMKTVMEYVKYFLEHLEYLAPQQMNPIAKAGYFGVLFDKAPTYAEIKLGTPKTAAAIELNRLFMAKNMNDIHLAGEKGHIPTF